MLIKEISIEILQLGIINIIFQMTGSLFMMAID